ncbi:MAG: hypothetical protein B6V02_02730, partial [Thermoprotei archaeon ex4572_64]
MRLIRIYGIAIFSVNRDLDVVLFDMESIGMKSHDVETIHYSLLNQAEREFKEIVSTYEKARDYVLSYNGKLILVRFFLKNGNRVSKAILVSTRCGIIRGIVKKLEKLG